MWMRWINADACKCDQISIIIIIIIINWSLKILTTRTWFRSLRKWKKNKKKSRRPSFDDRHHYHHQQLGSCMTNIFFFFWGPNVLSSVCVCVWEEYMKTTYENSLSITEGKKWWKVCNRVLTHWKERNRDRETKKIHSTLFYLSFQEKIISVLPLHFDSFVIHVRLTDWLTNLLTHLFTVIYVECRKELNQRRKKIRFG